MTDAPVDDRVDDPETRAGAPVTWSYGQEVAHPSVDTYLATIGALKDEGFILCADVTGVDYLERPVRAVPAGVAQERFEVVVNLISLEPARRVRVRVQVPEVDCTVPSLFALYPGTEAMEREVFDLMGIRFDGHPDLTRILLPEDWEGHPLRKDYPIGRVPVQFKAAPPTR
ncbi:MAG: NADH-quinone oxidoreductase subunit C [Acidimicrobiales bacterium]